MVPPRLELIDTTLYGKLDPADKCFHIGEYTSGGGWQASETNRQIYNLKWREGYWHDESVKYWARQLAAVLDIPTTVSKATLVPAPSSKPAGHANHSDRMTRILGTLRAMAPGLDVRAAVETKTERASQHEHGRLTVNELAASMRIVPAEVQVPLKSIVIVVDDVFTQGGTFKAMQTHLGALAGVRHVRGLFLAKTVWPQPTADDF